MHNPIKAVYFDYDGVLGKDVHSYITTCRYLSGLPGLDVTYDKLVEAYAIFAPQLRTGKITEREMWPDFCAKLNTDIDFSYLERAFAASEVNQDMIKIAKKLKESNIAVGIITDNTNLRIETIAHQKDLDSLFHPIINGCGFATSKTNTRSAVSMFEAALKALNIRAEEAVFIDNTADNLDVPEAMGFHVYHHDGELNDMLALKIYLSGFGLNV